MTITTSGISARTTVLGAPFTVIAVDDVVVASGWTEDVDELLALVHARLRPDTVTAGELPAVLDAVRRYDGGDLSAVDDIPVRQRSDGRYLETAWTELRRVAPGRPLSYRDFAARFGQENGGRVGAQACSKNAAALFVPCHRIQRSDGSMGGFRYGIELKQRLQAHEIHHSIRAA
ncbi:methylated-DNA--[protein]-cysteine S-methyltransferase [Williamsia deligens]|uniref:Methylated-DNA--[protein]-cysteine S-methyltransferase n=1 Tax=Williamsia deligens TaxID=321325 RepID=A0ABW3G1F9_9NOCA|nr:methylated-DNA--[protein]-cysteine S-methyltransferase [Williamsia deligens]MCP2194915.1 methylated-DNA-[protein]-cysteine S-methyltransferase [Williamsia deligens]